MYIYSSSQGGLPVLQDCVGGFEPVLALLIVLLYPHAHIATISILLLFPGIATIYAILRQPQHLYLHPKHNATQSGPLVFSLQDARAVLRKIIPSQRPSIATLCMHSSAGYPQDTPSCTYIYRPPPFPHPTQSSRPVHQLLTSRNLAHLPGWGMPQSNSSSLFLPSLHFFILPSLLPLFLPYIPRKSVLPPSPPLRFSLPPSVSRSLPPSFFPPSHAKGRRSSSPR